MMVLQSWYLTGCLDLSGIRDLAGYNNGMFSSWETEVHPDGFFCKTWLIYLWS